MFKMTTREYEEGGIAYKEVNTSLFGIPIKNEIYTTTNSSIVGGLKQKAITQKNQFKIKGFNDA